ncbi:FAD-binding oxidoreductase [Nitrosomonas sp.]|uniref:FAD-dependent oxidoreductase n=1 Tax=Nitrosomonas sp. TaxID=42353 RepID=UPI003305F557
MNKLENAIQENAAELDLFLQSVSSSFGEGLIVRSGSEYDLLAKDPAVNSHNPRAFVYPESVEQVQKLVRLATKHKVKLWVYSTGKNWGYLNTSASKDSVVVLLNRMNRIIHVDQELAYAIIEPGVTYEALSYFLNENNYTLWTDSPGGPPTGSVIGNALDRGVGVTKYGDHFAHLCGYEVVLADGSVIHTGVANNEGGCGAAHLYKWGVGPHIEGLFSQSNYGIVTKAGIWLMRKPEDYTLFSVNIRDDTALAKCMDTVRELMLSGTIHETGRFSNSVAILTLLTQAIDEGVEAGKAISRVQLEALKKKYSVPNWTGSFGIYGHSSVVRAASQVAKKQLEASRSCARINIFTRKRAQFIRRKIALVEKIQSELILKLIDFVIRKLLGSSLALIRLFPGLIDLHEGKPVETVVRRGYFRYRKKRPQQDIHVGRDDLGILWSVPVLPFRGEEIVAFTRECELLFEKFNFDFYMTTMIFNARSVCPLMVILYDRLDEIECGRAEQLYSAILDLSHQKGYQHFRAGINGWKKLYQYCPELKTFNQKIKAVLDPEGILAPGRYGID